VVPACQLLNFYEVLFSALSFNSSSNEIAIGVVVTVDRPSSFYRSADPSSLWKSSNKKERSHRIDFHQLRQFPQRVL
jgi:hypothetical protein